MQLRTFGELSLESIDFKQSRPLLLLAYLCLEGPQERRYLAELFWPKSNNALGNLTTVLSRLNKVDDSLVDIEGQLLKSHLSSDASELSKAFEKQDYETVLALYERRFLESFYLKDIGTELEEWLYQTRESLATKVRFAKLYQAESKAKKGLFEAAAKEAEQAYWQTGASEPTEADLERIYKLLTAGDSPLVSEVKKEALSYNLELSSTKEEAQKQFVSIIQSESAFSPSAENSSQKKHNLPTQLNSFIGREYELNELNTKLRHKNTHLVTLLGAGGMGKTRLALELAEQLYASNVFDDGVYFVTLAPLSSADLVAQAIAEALDLSLLGKQTPEQQVIHQIRDLEALIVLDNLEHLLDSTPFISEILKASPKLKLLITSRERLQIPAEWVYDLWGLSKEENDFTEKPFIDAIRLFEQRAKQVNSSFALDTENDHVLDICRSVEGMPLGIELAASWADTISIRDIALEINESSSFLEANSKLFPERHRSLVHVMDYSWQRLSAKEQTVFKRLSLFRGGFDYAAAKQVATASAKDLANLTSKTLIRLNNNRYEVHELLRQYAFEKLAEASSELSAVEANHATYYADFMDKLKLDLMGAKQLEALSKITADLDNVLLSWDWAVKAGDTTVLTKIINSFRIYCEMQGLSQLGISIIDKVLPQYRQWLVESSTDALKIGFAKLLHALIWFFMRTNNLDQLSTAHKEVENYYALLEIHEPLDYIHLTCMSATIYSAFNGQNTNAVKALSIIKKADYLARHLNADAYLGTVLMVWGQILQDQGKYEESQVKNQESIEAYERAGEQRFKAFALNTSGRASSAIGAYEEASSYFNKSLAIRKAFNDKVGLIYIQIDLGILETKLGNFDQASVFLHQSLTLCTQLQSTEQAGSLLALGRLALSQAKYKEAKTWFQQSIDHYKKGGRQEYFVQALSNLAYIHLLDKDYQEVKVLLDKSLALSDQGNSLLPKAQALVYMAYLDLSEHPNQTEKAKAKYVQALEITQTLKAAPLALSILADWATLENYEQPIELLSLVKYDKRSEFVTREKAKQRLNDLTQTEGFNEAIEQGKKLELWRVVASLV